MLTLPINYIHVCIYIYMYMVFFLLIIYDVERIEYLLHIIFHLHQRNVFMK